MTPQAPVTACDPRVDAMRMAAVPRDAGGSAHSSATPNEAIPMTDPYVTPEQQADLPSMLSGIKWFKGSAGLTIAWKLDAATQPPMLVCTLFTRAPHDELSYVPPISGSTTIRLTPWSGTQLFQLERQPLLGAVMQDSGNSLPPHTNGLIYLGGLLAAPDDVSGHKGDNAPLFLHVHCRLGASSGFRTKIARGTYGQFIEAMPSSTSAEGAAQKAAMPTQSAPASKPSIARKSKPRGSSKRPH
jgi:hypothetical protein